jgi:hypothetical protein
MLEKKLLTLAGTAGILACGACFLPPLPERKPPPPPPVRLDLQGIQRIRVDVINQAALHHLDPPELAAWVASEINLRGKRAGATADANDNLGDEDGVLQVTVLSETGTPEQQLAKEHGTEWRFEVIISAVLKTKAGQVVWRESDGGYRFFHSFAQESEADIWKEPNVLKFLTAGVGNRLVYRMVNDR